jgi:hypothetical protein
MWASRCANACRRGLRYPPARGATPRHNRSVAVECMCMWCASSRRAVHLQLLNTVLSTTRVDLRQENPTGLPACVRLREPRAHVAQSSCRSLGCAGPHILYLTMEPRPRREGSGEPGPCPWSVQPNLARRVAFSVFSGRTNKSNRVERATRHTLGPRQAQNVKESALVPCPISSHQSPSRASNG